MQRIRYNLNFSKDFIKRLTLLNLRERCRQMGDTVQLPSQNFGPSAMCRYCGSIALEYGGP